MTSLHLDPQFASPTLPDPEEVASLSRSLTRGVTACTWRMALRAPAPEPALSVLRGAFGAALHDLSLDAYEDVFRPTDVDRSPAYLFRHCAHTLKGRALFELTLFDQARKHEEVVLRALELACDRGLGRSRQRFTVDRLAWLDVNGTPSCSPQRFTLDTARWPLAGPPESTPCRVIFPAPVRILRQKELVEQPNLRDVVVAACRRLAGLSGPTGRLLARALQPRALAVAAERPAQTFVGDRARVGRWSATQQQRIELHGACGHFDLPAGPGACWQLLAALQHAHVGKATTIGLGRVVVTPIW